VAAEHPNRESRRPVDLRGVATLDDGTTQAVSLIDLSYDGCAIDIPVSLQKGDRLHISIARRGTIDTEVRWYSDGKAGLMFLPEPDADDVGEQERVPRDAARVQLEDQATIKRIGRRSYLVSVFDVSPGGLRFEFVDRPKVGETVLVTLAGLQPLEARVRWIEGTGAGVEFVNPIHPAVFDLLIEKMNVDPARPL
jgi:hypothetical protein